MLSVTLKPLKLNLTREKIQTTFDYECEKIFIYQK